MEEISQKQFLLTGYLEALLKLYFSRPRINHHHLHHHHYPHDDDNNLLSVNYIDDLPSVEILTPSDPKQRGSQLSISFSIPLCAVQEELKKSGIVVRISLSPDLPHTSESYLMMLIIHMIHQLVCHLMNDFL